MIGRVRRLSREYDMLPRGGTVLCAVSGGADSVCMLHLLTGLSEEMGFSVHCAHFNHKLRGAEADRDEAFVRAWCAGRGIPLSVGSADVAALAAQRGRGIEETARAARYEFLERTALETGAVRIATAHTADDNAETVLLHLVRGSGLQGLGGIPPRRGSVVRPLLEVTRRQVEDYCALHGLAYVEDSTNADQTYTRNYLRHRVIPLLEQINPRAVEHMAAAAGKARADHEYLNDLAEEIVSRAYMTAAGLEIEVRELTGQPEPVALRTVRRLMEQAGGGANCTQAHLESVLELCRGKRASGRADLPRLTVRREYDRLVFAHSNAREERANEGIPFREGETEYGSTGWTVSCRRVICPADHEKRAEAYYLSCEKVSGGPVLRPRRPGDHIKLPGRGTKSLKKLMIEEKVPLSRRNCVPVLADEAAVLAVAGFGPDAAVLAAPGEEAFEIIFRKRERNELL